MKITLFEFYISQSEDFNSLNFSWCQRIVIADYYTISYTVGNIIYLG